MVKFVSYFVRTYTQFRGEWMLLIFTYVEPQDLGLPRIACQIVQVSYKYLTFKLILSYILQRKKTFLLICRGRVIVLKYFEIEIEI